MQKQKFLLFFVKSCHGLLLIHVFKNNFVKTNAHAAKIILP